MPNGSPGQVEGGCLSFSCGCLTGGCLSAVFVFSLSVLVFAYGYWVGIIHHPGEYAYIRIRGDEMRPTICSGDIVLVDRQRYDQSSVLRGDIVWIEPEATPKHGGRLLLRVVGLPGETVSFSAEGKMQIDGKELAEYPELAGIPYRASGENSDPHVLGTNELYVIGDNPDYWTDSRANGPVPLKSLRGRAVAVLFPPHRAGKLN